jgi:hypothetical protein
MEGSAVHNWLPFVFRSFETPMADFGVYHEAKTKA